MNTLQQFAQVLKNEFYKNVHVTFEEYDQISNGIIDLCVSGYYQQIHDCIYTFLQQYIDTCKSFSQLDKITDVVNYITCFAWYYDYYTILISTRTISLQLITKRKVEIRKEIHNRVIDLTLVFNNFDSVYPLADIISLSLDQEIDYLYTVTQIQKIKNRMELDYS